MGESMSRYSIVERLTQTKLDIMSAKDALSEEIQDKEQGVAVLNRELANWKIFVKQDTARTQKQKEIAIANAKADLENTKQRKTGAMKTYDAKIKAIDEALDKIEEISKASVAQSESPESR